MIRFACPGCDTELQAAGSKAGGKAKCPACGQMFLIPDEQPEPAPEEFETAREEEPARGPSGPRRRAAKGTTRRYDDDDEDERPRRRKRRRSGGAGGLVGSIPLGYTAQVNIGVGIGLVVQVIGLTQLPSPVGIVLILLGWAFFLWGCAAYAKNKGYPEFFGFLGVLGLLGLIILVVLPHQSGE